MHQKTDWSLADLTLSPSELPSFLRADTDKQCVSHHFTLQALKDTVNKSNCVLKYGIIPEIVDIICKYCGVLTWSLNTKIKSNINLIESNDGNISYALLKGERSESVFLGDWTERSETGETVFFGDWIDRNKKQIHRFVLRYYTDLVPNPKHRGKKVTDLKIGIVNSMIACADELHPHPDYDHIRWRCSGMRCEFESVKLSDKIYTNGSDTIHWGEFLKQRWISHYRDTYLLVEIDNNTNYIRVYCNAIYGRMQYCSIPKQFERYIMLAVSLCPISDATLGIGMVKVNI